jgi:hypothetical protein
MLAFVAKQDAPAANMRLRSTDRDEPTVVAPTCITAVTKYTLSMPKSSMHSCSSTDHEVQETVGLDVPLSISSSVGQSKSLDEV